MKSANKKSKVLVILLLLITGVFISITILAKPLKDGDEFINFYNTYKMFMGQKIYKEVNVVSTPLLFYIGLLILKVLGARLISFRILAIVINIIIEITLYRIFRNLNIRRKYSTLYTIIIELILCIQPIRMGATYNLLGIMFLLIGVNMAIKRSNVKHYFLKQGIIVFLIFMSKQNMGVFYALANIITELVIYKKEGLKNIAKIMLLPLISSIFYLIYLYIDGSLAGFINYTVLGAKEFSTNLYTYGAGIGWMIIDIVIIIFVSMMLKKKLYKQEQKQIILTLFIIGICNIFIGYPIADYWHMSLASVVLIILIIYVLQENLDIKISKKIINTVLIIIIAFMAVMIIFKSWVYLSTYCNDKTSKFYLITIYDDQKNKIKTMSEYIQNADKKVIIASPEAGKFYIDLNMESNGILDLPWRGNLGKNGTQTLIDKVTSYKDVYILIHTEKKDWQEIDEFRDFVKNNYEKVDTIEDFDVYYIK